MRKVIDTNYLRDVRLSEFLRASPSNIAVLPDYIAWEAYKKNPISTMERSLDILSNYASQVKVLKSMKRIVRQSFRMRGYVNRMIDKQQTLEFGKFCKILKQTSKGDPSYVRSILEKSETMRNHLMKLEEALSDGVEKRVDSLRKTFTAQEWRDIRAGIPGLEAQKKFLVRVMGLAHAFNASVDGNSSHADVHEFVNALTFRYALAITLLDESWAAAGGAKNVRPQRHLNDEVDINILVYATYFDGFLSNDAKATRIYKESRQILNDLGC